MYKIYDDVVDVQLDGTQTIADRLAFQSTGAPLAPTAPPVRQTTMGDASRPYPHPHTNNHHLALPSFHDFNALARHYDLGVGPSRGNGNRPPRFDNQHFMSEVNAANAGTNGAAGSYGYDEPASAPPMTGDPTFDILDWYPAYQSCQRYFLDIAQHEPGTQALCALINIRLPYQYLDNPITSSCPPTSTSDSNNNASNTNLSPSGQSSNSTSQFSFPQQQQPQQPTNLPSPSRSSQPPSTPFVSLIPYLRRLTITGFDKPAILHGFFGDDYPRGVLPHLDCERRNYLFAAKHGGWRTCKKQYDVGSGLGGDETAPFMKPLDHARGEELAAAERAWGKWLAMEDWMVGPNAPGEEMDERGGGNVEAQRTGRRGENQGQEFGRRELVDGVEEGYVGQGR